MINAVDSIVSKFNLKNKKTDIAFGAKPMPFDVAYEIKSKFLNPNVKSFDAYCHAPLDEDTTNSMRVFVNWLKKNNKEVSMCMSMQNIKGLLIEKEIFKLKKGEKPSDMAILFDFNSASRFPKAYKNLFQNTQTENIYGFDHHKLEENPIKGNFYMDTSARSCCGIVYRFFESLNEPLGKEDLKRLYCGMLSDYTKSKLVTFKNSRLIKLPALGLDKNSKEVLENIQSQICPEDKIRVHKRLDILSNLNPKEKAFKERIFSQVQVTPDGKLAYVIIPPADKQWIGLGMKNTRTSAILRDLRLRLLNGLPDDIGFTPEQKQKIGGVQGSIIFYRSGNDYRMSIHSKNGYAERLQNYIKMQLNPDLIAGGLQDRQGGQAESLKKDSVKKFIEGFLIAAEKID